MGIFIEAGDLADGFGGDCQLLFLFVSFGYLLKIGCGLISDGAELLLLVPSCAGIVGSVILPVLGAVPDGAIVLFSGLGSDAQKQLTVGVGALAGSTVMLLTLPWALSVIAGRVNIQNGKPIYTRPANHVGVWQKLNPPNHFSLLGTGVSTRPDVKKNARLMLLTTISYVVIQGPAFYYLGHDHSAHTVSKHEKNWALAGFILSFTFFVLYLALEFFHNTHSEQTEQLTAEVSARAIQDGQLSLAATMVSVLAAHQQQPDELLDQSVKKAVQRRLRLVLRPFFVKYDLDGNGTLSLQELRAVFKDLGESPTADLERIFRRFDTDNSGSIDFHEFVDGVADYLISNQQIVRAHHARQSELEMVDVPVAEAGRTNESNEEEEEEEDAEVPEDISKMPIEQQQRAIKLRAGWMLAVGTALVLLFSDPMVSVFAEIGVRTKIPAFYISFVLAPVASNLSEVLASYR
eukprot:c8273_g2_i1.p1 GENE.c8273_g2_i1~~c8273_g2_i1.p1  ORF type:complete len:462 (+),score=97.44 c8273_g2_i1:940-2325(+)